MSREPISFQRYKEYLKEQALSRRWKVVNEDNDFLVLQNRDRPHHENKINTCKELTQVMEEKYGEQCLVYRCHRIKGMNLFQESYHVILRYTGNMYKFNLITKKDNLVTKEEVMYSPMNENWLSDVESLAIPSSLKSARNHFETLIKELPEFRLFHATGLT